MAPLRPGPTDDRWWAPPFNWSVDYTNEHWCNRRLGDGSCLVQVLKDGIEVARVEIDDPGGINPRDTNVPYLGAERLEIQFIEVPTAARGRKVGTEVVQMLAGRHRDRRLFAYSLDADRFWAQLGLEPFYDPGPGPAGRTLFIQPPR